MRFGSSEFFPSPRMEYQFGQLLTRDSAAEERTSATERIWAAPGLVGSVAWARSANLRQASKLRLLRKCWDAFSRRSGPGPVPGRPPPPLPLIWNAERKREREG